MTTPPPGNTPAGAPPIIAAAYLRKSNEQHVSEDQTSVATQRKRAHAYAEKNGWTLDERFIWEDDAISGAEFKKRPGFSAVIDAITAPSQPPFSILLVEDQSRLGRDLIRTLSAIQAVTEAAGRGRLGQLEAEERELRADADLVERLRGVWGDWVGALQADPLLARETIRRTLTGRILVVPCTTSGTWTFMGIAGADGILAGRVSGAGAAAIHYGTVDQSRAIAELLRSLLDGEVREIEFEMPTSALIQPVRPARPITGGSDAQFLVGRSPGGPPLPPHARSAPAKPWHPRIPRAALAAARNERGDDGSPAGACGGGVLHQFREIHQAVAVRQIRRAPVSIRSATSAATHRNPHASVKAAP